MPKSGKHLVNNIDSFFKVRPSISNIREGESISFLEKGKLFKQEKRNGVVYQQEFTQVSPTLSTDTDETGNIHEIIAGAGLTGGGLTGEITLDVVGGTGIDANADDIAIDSTVVTLTGSQTLTNKTLTAPTFTGTAQGASLTLTGDLTVQGDTTTLNTATLQVEDKNIVLNYHASNDTSSSAEGAGITIQDAVDASTDATILWDQNPGEFDFSHAINVTGNISVSGTVDGRDLATDGSKLDGIEALADITDTANVTSAGALMDSELTSIADVKALDQSVISGASPTFGTANMTDASNKRFMSDAQETVLNNTSGTNTGDESDASASVKGIVELATTAETTTGTDTTRAVTPDGLKDGYQGSTNVTTLGTISTGTWNGTAIASAYLDSDTAHLSGTQTFSGAKTFSSLASFTMDGNTITGIDDSGEFTNDDAHIMTSAAVEDKILSYGYTTSTGTVDTSGTPVDNDFAKFTDANTIEGRSASETRSDLGLVVGTNVQAQDTLLQDIADFNPSDNSNDGKVLALNAGAGELEFVSLPSAGTITGASNMTNNNVLTAVSSTALRGESSLTFDGTSLQLSNDKILSLGDDDDIKIYHNSSSGNGNIENYSGSLYVTNYVDDADIIFRSDNGSGGTTAYITLDGSDKDVDIDVPSNLTGRVTITDGGADGLLMNNDTGNSADSARIFFEGTSTSVIMQQGNDLSFRVNATTGSSSGTERVVIREAGMAIFNASLGVGTNANGANGRIAATSHIEAGVGSGAIGLTINDGGGNSNVTFNHTGKVPEQNGNSGRIEVNTDSSGGEYMAFELAGNVTSGVSVATTEIARINSTGLQSSLSGTASSPALRVNDSDTGLYRIADNKIGISTAGTFAVAVDSSQNVGIGTTSPSQKLQVAGHTRISGVGNGLYFDTTGSTESNVIATINDYETLIATNRGSAGFGVIGNSDIRLGFGTSYNTAQTKLYINGSSGNVGIGTSSPDSKLEVAGVIKASVAENNYAFEVENSTEANFKYRIYNDGSTTGEPLTFRTGLYYGTTENSSIHFYRGGSSTGGYLTFQTNNGNERMRIDSSGNVGIGTTSPGYKFDVTGDINLTGSLRKNGLAMISIDGSYTTILKPNGSVGIYLGQSDAAHYYDNTRHRFRPSGGGSNYYANLGATGLSLSRLADAEAKLHIGQGSNSNNAMGTNTLGTTAGDKIDLIKLETDTTNASQLIFRQLREADGSSWTSSGTRILARTDVTEQSYIQFNGNGNQYGLSFGAGTSSEAMRIVNGGNVGISETSPDTKLHIKTTGSGTTSLLKLEDNARLMFLGRDAIAVKDLSNNAAQLYINSNTTFSGSIALGYGAHFNNGNTNFLLYNNSGEDVLYMRDTTNGQMLQTWRVSSVDIHRGMTINQDGGAYDTRIEGDTDTHLFFADASADRIGIGTGSPGGKLHVQGSASANNLILGASMHTVGGGHLSNYQTLLFKNTYNETGYAAIRHFANSHNDSASQLRFLTANTSGNMGNRMTIDDTGYIGIGTVTPTEMLDITGANSDTYVRIHNNGGYESGIEMLGGSLDVWKIYLDDADNKLRIDEDGTAYMTISNGNVLIGGTSASGHGFNLEVLNDHAYVKGPDGWNGNGDKAIVALGSGVSNESFGCGYVYGTGLVLSTYKTSGGGHFGSSTQNSLIIADTTGKAEFINDVVAFASSDKRLKENIKPLDNALDKINKINGVEFDWIDGKDEYGNSVHGNEGHDVGVIAQEIEEVLPEVVTTRDNGYKAVKYEKIVPLLIEAIKEQSKQINELKEKLNG